MNVGIDDKLDQTVDGMRDVTEDSRTGRTSTIQCGGGTEDPPIRRMID